MYIYIYIYTYDTIFPNTHVYICLLTYLNACDICILTLNVYLHIQMRNTHCILTYSKVTYTNVY